MLWKAFHNFFREIKQLLHIKSFIGTTENAVKIQIWTALITILILKALKAIAKHRWYLSNLLGFNRLNLFVKIDLHQWLDYPFESRADPPETIIQGTLFLLGKNRLPMSRNAIFIEYLKRLGHY